MINTLKQIAFDFRLKAGYTAAFVLLLISYILTLVANKQLIKSTSWVNHTNSVIQNLEGLNSSLKEAEASVRGYIITRDSSFLVPYQRSISAVDSFFVNIKLNTRDNNNQQESLARLRLLIKKKYDRLKFATDLSSRGTANMNDTLAKTGYAGKYLMDSINITINSIRKTENDLLESRKQEVGVGYKALNAIIIISLILALVFAVLGFFTYKRENNARMESDKIVNAYQKELQERIIELDKANKELILMKRSEKFAATGRIARTIAHEVRNPLTNIDLAISQIKNDMPQEDESSNMLFGMVERNSKRINQLISELLSATRFAELTYVSVSINELLDESLVMASDRIELNQIKVTKKYGANIRDISVDPDKIRIAFLNLIVNAIEAMETGKGILEIVTKGEEKMCVVEITDNGYGMTEEQLNNLFEPYFTTKPDGNGLGLTNTQNIILNHKGSINVTSKPGAGTTFTIKFNFADPA